MFRVGYVEEKFPFIYRDRDGDFKGLIVDIYESFAASRNTTLEMVEFDAFGEFFQGISLGE